MFVAEKLKIIIQKFIDAKVECAKFDAEIIISEVLNLKRSELLLYDKQIPKNLLEEIDFLVNRRVKREPLQYILGKAYFMDLTLKVDNRVLIPRFETEILVEWIWNNAPKSSTLLDIGCGSGAISLASGYRRKDLEITAVDISNDALALAKENSVLNNINNVKFIHSDLFTGVENMKFDLIAANLPYVSEEEYQTLEVEVKEFEPKLALTALDNGFELIEKVAKELKYHLSTNGKVIFELSSTQANRLKDLLEFLNFKNVEIIKDYTHRERFVTAQFIQ